MPTRENIRKTEELKRVLSFAPVQHGRNNQIKKKIKTRKMVFKEMLVSFSPKKPKESSNNCQPEGFLASSK